MHVHVFNTLKCIIITDVYEECASFKIFIYITGTGMSPFGRYSSTFGAPNHNFPSLSTFPPREMGGPLGGLGSVHDPWRGCVDMKY